MTRVICLASGKGGVGKTVTTANLAAALAKFGERVVAIDGNLTTSNLGLHLGIPLYPVTIQDVLRKKARLKEATYYHPAGFRVIPADVSFDKFMLPKANDLLEVFYRLTGDAGFVLIDSAAGLGKEAQAAIEASDEMITITSPELPAMTDALKLGKMAENFDTKNIGVIINRVRGESFEFKADGVEDFLSLPVLGHVHESVEIPRSVARGEPVVTHKPGSKPAQQFMAIAAKLIGEDYRPKFGSGLVSRVFGWLR